MPAPEVRPEVGLRGESWTGAEPAPTMAGPGLGGRRECGRLTLFVLTL